MEAKHLDRDWMIPSCLLLMVALILWSASHSAGLAYAPMITAYGAFALATLGLVVAVRLLIALRRRRKAGEPRPLAGLLTSARSDPSRIISVVAGLQLVAIGSSAFSALKAAMPKTVPFWLDEPLATAEFWALGGADPWQVSHALLGWGTPTIDQIYATFVPVHLLAVFAVLTGIPSARKSRALVALFLIWLLIGVAGAYLLSSAGPIFYDRAFGGETFAPLTQALGAAPITTATADLLWHYHQLGRPAIANGVSAMPSMHVALTLWLALVLKDTKFAPLGWTYYALIWLGSVHLGWHYAADGLIATAGVLLIWKLTPLLLPRSRSAMLQPIAAHAGAKTA